MKITKIEPQKMRPGRRSIWVDGKFCCGVSEEVLLKTGLREEQVVTEEELSQLMGGEERRRAKDYALNLLGYRMRSEKELKDRLKAKGYSGESIEAVIDDFRRVDLVNDLEFARAWIRNRTATNPRGSQALRSELWKKGLSEETIAEAISEFSADHDEAHIASELARKKFGTSPDLADPAVRRRLLGFLARRGFSYQICEKVLEDLKK